MSELIMPARGVKRIDLPESYYHVYNRGAFKHAIFLDEKDRKTFCSILREESRKRLCSIKAFAVLPNHYHLLIFQKKQGVVSSFLKSIGIKYTLYFQHKYKHSGRIFQGQYKAHLLTSKAKIEETKQYILQNPRNAGLSRWKFFGTENSKLL